MRSDPVTVSHSLTVAQLVEDFIYRRPFKMFPVMKDGELVGCVEIDQIKEIPRSEWERRLVGEVARPCTAENTISPETDAVQALSIMNRTRVGRLLVVERGRLVGILSLKDLLRFLSLKVELDESEEKAA